MLDSCYCNSIWPCVWRCCIGTKHSALKTNQRDWAGLRQATALNKYLWNPYKIGFLFMFDHWATLAGWRENGMAVRRRQHPLGSLTLREHILPVSVTLREHILPVNVPPRKSFLPVSVTLWEHILPVRVLCVQLRKHIPSVWVPLW